ncbi:glycosyltransferase family 2 protein [Sphingomonas panacisoli]|uniref:Glycosyltransferase family 2 protein n=1 Tax=Sphingomonas panacisoli TaxID=1813879 RepID=A0A5B8LLK9_9SPHN|nr:glycosyltransferase family 2 protein [Sphingomonas panacisoli]QDZ08454.1 glycosyltransferase family 2 protein [Sphingomonas panacisoli]
MTGRRPSLAVVLIVRNEARCIARCLDSVRPWVDRIVMLDTGSTDDTIAIAQGCGAEVHEMIWPDSFAEARNAALLLADADWNLVVDADEWIESGGECLRDWCGGSARLGRVTIASDGAAGNVTRNRITRLLPRGVRFVGRVHEQVESDLPRVHVDLTIGHDGYAEAQLARKYDRNRPLLLAELSDAPDDPYLHYQLGKDAQMRGDERAASVHFATALTLSPVEANWRHELVVAQLHALAKSGQLDEAIEFAEEHRQTWARSPDFHFVLGDVLLDCAIADPANAVGHWLPHACASWERCLAIGERPDLEGSVPGRGSHLARHNLDLVRAQLAMLAA